MILEGGVSAPSTELLHVVECGWTVVRGAVSPCGRGWMVLNCGSPLRVAEEGGPYKVTRSHTQTPEVWAHPVGPQIALLGFVLDVPLQHPAKPCLLKLTESQPVVALATPGGWQEDNTEDRTETV